MLAPSCSARASVAWNASSTPGSMPSPVSSSGTPRRTPSRRSALGSAISSGSASDVGVALVAADHVAQHQRRVGHVAGERAGLVERGGERDHPVARDGAVGGLQADDPAQRGRLADRAAGVGAERPRREPGRDRGGAPARGAAGHARAVPRVEHRPVGRSSRWRSPSRTRPGWSWRAAAPRPPRGARRPWRCREAGSPRGSASPTGWGRPRCRRGP